MFHRRLFSSSKHRRASEVPSGADPPSPKPTSSRTKSLESGVALVVAEGPGGPSRQHGAPDQIDQERRPRATSDTPVSISSTNLSVRPLQRQRTPSRASDPLGLSLLYSPNGDALADIVFVHGLGGSSRLSWCMRHDLDMYWPLKWLPNDPDVRQTRIFTFGYNADFRSSSQSANLGISDFSKTLLFDMLYGRDEDGKPFDFGQMILDEDSAKLGYPGEISRSLNADHHGVCKFDTPENPNYRAVLGALKSLVTSYSDNNSYSLDSEMQMVRSLLCIPENPEHDLNYFGGRRAQGTSYWILEHPKLRSWTSSPSVSELLWLFGRPARGKSILASFLVHHLRDEGAAVQYFFFRSGDETKRSIGVLLRLLAFQIASQLPPFRKALVKLSDGGYKPKDADWKATWKKLYTGLLFTMESCTPLYWVIDALDESYAGQQVLELLADIHDSSTPIHVLVTSRSSPGLSTSFERVNSRLLSSRLSIDQEVTDMEIYVEEELQYLGWDPSVKAEVRKKILAEANDNFLWVHLILEEIKECHTEDDVKATLSALPPGMESLYQRMEKSLGRIRRPSERNLSRQLFIWAIYARRSLSIDELRSLLEAEFGHILDMASTVSRLCGHFLVIESNNRVGLLHQTAREYLISSKNMPFSVDASDAHNELFQRSLSVFMDKGLRSQTSTTGYKFLKYRATSWMHHLKALGETQGSD
ncbi:hypothetical protein DL764_005895 [Monosporascus ibericus]|uniref:NACHT domain-containing protein n=1 Tax=Monosporascus ibericus TaxID=155417 RepID=A0A4Q4T6Y9_9PEZI|nr:hypothetical protein DL764_005895 [Monosporascus ibericus]